MNMKSKKETLILATVAAAMSMDMTALTEQ